MTGTNKKLFRSIISIVMVVAMILGCVGVLSGCSKIEKAKKDKEYEKLSDAEYFQTLQLEALDEVVDAITDGYGAYTDMSDVVSGNFGGKAELSLQVGDLILEQLEQSLAQSAGMTMDLSFLSSVGLSTEIDATNGLTQLKLGLGLSGTQILYACMLMSDETIWIGAPDLSDAFLEFNMADMGVTLDPAQAEMITGMLNVLPDEDKVGEMLNRYLALALKEIDQVERKQETLELDGLKQDCTVLTAKITEADTIDMAKAILSTAKEDQDLKKIIDDFSGYYNEVIAVAGAGTDVDAYAEFTKAVDEALESLGKQQIDSESAITLVSYVDEDHNIIGNSLTLPEATSAAFTCYTVSDGKAFKSLVEIKDADLEIIGAGTNVDGVIDGEYTITVGGTAYLDMELVDYDATKENAISGTIRLEPTADLMDMIMGGSNMLSLADVVFELKLDIAETDGTVAFNLLTNDTLLVGIALKIGEKTPNALQQPTNTVSPLDEAALTAWIGSLDLTTIFGNLRTAGVPEDLVTTLEGISAMFVQ